VKIKRVIVGPLATNCYIVSLNQQTLIIDPGAEPEKIFSALPTADISQIILTHAHPDHLGAVSALKNEFPQAEFLLHRAELPILKNLRFQIKPDGFLKEGNFSFFNFQFSIIYTPGHTPGAICLRFENVLFTGDTLFARGLGRTDFPYGRKNDLIKSLKKLETLPKNLKIYPGHGESSTLGQALARLSKPLAAF